MKRHPHAKGEERAQRSPAGAVPRLDILVRGQFVLRVADREVAHGKEVDGVRFGPGVAHSFRPVEGSLVVTVRWPSVSIA